ncbi:uncharacterized protein N7511_001952 [Penicillium nucicola]|uniref:uncharacterized protein n=1 Tax=Penicillium nucicola TaxID=1850975 RepID=UPI002544D81D|nr:uncharacterized protein N7511_001952 [Penicillium nucicola]KAJ5769901.1 hypothetical protein N7511_001952 [Penicillium nucicola]
MKIASFGVSIALLVPRAIAATPTTTTATPSCTASVITSLCSYPEPTEFAVAIDSRASCWDYCNAHPPCSFEIFVPGNPTLGDGTCWLYPGQTFDASKGSSNCSDPYLTVYAEPVCAGSSATTTSGACAATRTPSAIASVCGYPAPEDCFDDCIASTGPSNCLSECASADACSYAVFNPADTSSPYGAGNCWVFPNGTYNAASATTCTGAPKQYVYKNPCPKSSSSSSATGRPSATGTAATTSGFTTSAASASSTSSKNSAPTGPSLANPLALGAAALMWHAL